MSRPKRKDSGCVDDDLEWVSESTIALQEEEVIMRGAMVHVMVLRANTAESNTGKGSKNQTLDRAIAETISGLFWCLHTPRTCMLASVATVLHKTHRKWRVNKEMEGWEMGGRPELLP